MATETALPGQHGAVANAMRATLPTKQCGGYEGAV